MLDTARGPMDASLLAVREERSTTPAGTLVSKSYFFEGELVKLDQNLEISEAALAAVGNSSL